MATDELRQRAIESITYADKWRESALPENGGEPRPGFAFLASWAVAQQDLGNYFRIAAMAPDLRRGRESDSSLLK
jgi:hypothetical protein